MPPTILEEIATNELVRNRLAKLMALECFRNTRLEDFHEGTPATQSGDYSDVRVVTPFGEIAWREVSRLSDDDMKLLMIDVTNHCHKFFSELFLGARGEAIIETLRERDPMPKWHDRERREPSTADTA